MLGLLLTGAMVMVADDCTYHQVLCTTCDPFIDFYVLDSSGVPLQEGDCCSEIATIEIQFDGVLPGEYSITLQMPGLNLTFLMSINGATTWSLGINPPDCDWIGTIRIDDVTVTPHTMADVFLFSCDKFQCGG